MFFISRLCVSVFWPGMDLNQRQLSIVVSDWESYLGSLFCHLRLWDCCFLLALRSLHNMTFCGLWVFCLGFGLNKES